MWVHQPLVSSCTVQRRARDHGSDQPGAAGHNLEGDAELQGLLLQHVESRLVVVDPGCRDALVEESSHLRGLPTPHWPTNSACGPAGVAPSTQIRTGSRRLGASRCSEFIRPGSVSGSTFSTAARVACRVWPIDCRLAQEKRVSPQDRAT
jgi:hypothetical protein